MSWFNRRKPSVSGGKSRAKEDQAYLEEFEGDQGISLSMRENLWQFGSRPQFGEGLTDAMAGLATFPRRNPFAPETFRGEVR